MAKTVGYLCGQPVRVEKVGDHWYYRIGPEARWQGSPAYASFYEAKHAALRAVQRLRERAGCSVEEWDRVYFSAKDAEGLLEEEDLPALLRLSDRLVEVVGLADLRAPREEVTPALWILAALHLFRAMVAVAPFVNSDPERAQRELLREWRGGHPF